jgi:two-component system chemotaxis sensor kinase CheA
MDTMALIKQTFFQECEERLAELESGLTAIEGGDADPETINAVFRAVHSIKGGAGAFGLEELVRFAHVFESTLDQVRNNRLAASPELLKVMLRAADILADLVRAGRDGTNVDTSRSSTVVAALSGFINGGGGGGGPAHDDDGMDGLDFKPIVVSDDLFELVTEPEPVTYKYTIKFKPKPALYAKANETTLILREVSRLGEATVTCDSTDLPLLPELDPEGAYLTWIIELETQQDEAGVREAFEFVEWDCEFSVTAHVDPESGGADINELIAKVRQAAAAEPEPPARTAVVDLAEVREAKNQEAAVHKAEPGAKGPPVAAADTAQASIRVDLDRVDRLINLVGELVINQAMLSQRVTEAGLARASAVAVGLEELGQLTREIQDSVMAIRAQPVKSVFQRMPRLVREVAAMTNKSVRLVTEGEATEVDKTVIERLADPLTHMIRNAIDHGLEKPEARLAAGKPEEGIVRLTALHRSGRIVIEVSDDGAGINRPRVKQIAIDRGLIASDAQLSDDEIDNLIFLPGFSTAPTVSDISGRGVGMDVVKRSIQALGGRISISSRPGQGSTFTMSLPLTLAVLDGMVVTVAGQTLVVPLTAIVETLQPKVADVHGFGGGARVIAIRKNFTPLIDVGQELGYRMDPSDPLAGVALLVESEGGARSALLVDAIQGQRQVVIKSLEANYRHVPGIAAATILGDGRVALILDVDTVVASSRSEGAYLDPVFAA